MLWFIVSADRADDPLVNALLELVRHVWAPRSARGAQAGTPVATAG